MPQRLPSNRSNSAQFVPLVNSLKLDTIADFAYATHTVFPWANLPTILGLRTVASPLSEAELVKADMAG